MQAMQRKLLRELWHTRWQALAILLIMASGVSIVIMSVSTLQSLEATRAAFYSQTHFANVFVQLKRAPLSLLTRLRNIAGTATVEARVVKSVTLDVPGLSGPAMGRMVSLPDHGEATLNRLYLKEGRLPNSKRRGETVISQAFAEAHRLKPGDSIKAIINGKQTSLLIVGTGLSPEYIYTVRPGELLPDDKRFGVLWIGYDELASAYDLDGAFNDLSVTLQPGASERAVLHQLNDCLAPYGGTDAYGRDQQQSHRILENEMVQLRTMALVPPAIFLGVTAFLLHVVMSRMVTMQREQVAMLRAFGYTRLEISNHFLGYAFVISVLGTILGVFVGAFLGGDLTELYSKFFRFPEYKYGLDWRLVVFAALSSVVSTFAGVIHAVWRAASESPVQAMQPEAPLLYRPSLLERWGLAKSFSQLFRMVLRHLERNPVRTFLSSLGISFSIAILIMGNFLEDTVDKVLDFQFFVVQRHDLMVVFPEAKSGRALRELAHMRGVTHAEPFRMVPIRLVHQFHERRLELMGLPQESQLFRVVDPIRGPVVLPSRGLVISRRLAEILECRVGDLVRVDVLEGRRMVQQVPVSRILDDYLDLNAYMDVKEVRRILQEEDTISGAFLQADPLQVEHLHQQLKETPQIAGVSMKHSAIESYQRTMAETLLRMKSLNVIFASIVAFGVVYNSARISLAERSRELATLRVLGFTKAEVSAVFLGELAVLVCFAIPWGMLFGYSLAWLLTTSLQTEVHRFPMVVYPATYLSAVLVTIVSSIVSALMVRRRMDRFDLVSVLKARD